LQKSGDSSIQYSSAYAISVNHMTEVGGLKFFSDGIAEFYLKLGGL
jgi:hypothetical protein